MDDDPVIPLLLSLIGATRVFFRSRGHVALEILALRQQLAVLKRRRPRPPLRLLDRLFWTLLRATWPRWRDAILIVRLETVVGWHRAGFRLYWRWKSRPRGGTAETRTGASRVDSPHGERKHRLGRTEDPRRITKAWICAVRATVARYLPRTRGHGDAGKKWLVFLHNHREAIVAFDFFTVPTASFRILYCFFIIEHERRKILHFNVTRHPSAEWVVQPLRATFAEAAPYRYAILDHDSVFNREVVSFLEATGLKPMRTSIRSPWQNGTAERWIGSCRREILDHRIPTEGGEAVQIVTRIGSFAVTAKGVYFTVPGERSIQFRDSITGNVSILVTLAAMPGARQGWAERPSSVRLRYCGDRTRSAS